MFLNEIAPRQPVILASKKFSSLSRILFSASQSGFDSDPLFLSRTGYEVSFP